MTCMKGISSGWLLEPNWQVLVDRTFIVLAGNMYWISVWKEKDLAVRKPSMELAGLPSLVSYAYVSYSAEHMVMRCVPPAKALTLRLHLQVGTTGQ